MEVPVAIAPETKAEGSDIHFEPGMHPIFPFQTQEHFTRLYRGDLEAQGWNKEVGERTYSSFLFNL